ncbi:MAG: glycosyl hydrolase-related protein, partial [Thermoproteota archaeon]|nr:glycosyl hydrolase-related protein [Thermoproteota archaeon]
DFSNREQNIGVTLTHFGIPSHEIRDNSIYLTLLRGVETLSADGTKGPCIATPDAAEKRPYTFRYSLSPHNGDWREFSSYKEGIGFNMKPIAIHLVNKIKVQKASAPNNTIKVQKKSGSISFMSISPKNVILSTLKLPQQEIHSTNDNAAILRIYETEGKTVDTSISFYFPLKSAKFLDLLEDEKIDAKEKIEIGGINNNSINFIMSPFKIRTLQIVFDFDG